MSEVMYYRPELEKCCREELQRLQNQKFLKLLEKVMADNPYYRQKYADAGLSDIRDIKSLDDLRKIPFNTKRELMADQEFNPPFGTNFTYPLNQYTRYHETSGTTGKALKMLDTRESWEWFINCWGYIFAGAGIGPGERIFFPFSFSSFICFWGAFEGAKNVGAMIIPDVGQDIKARLNFIMGNLPTVVCCTPSYILWLAEIAREQGIDLTAYSVRKTVHTGEPGANIPSTKKKIEEAWGAESFDNYGMSEIGAVSFECAAHTGGMHIIETEYIAEIIDPDTGKYVPEGQDGELVLTNLGRLSNPNIRYRTGDRVRLSTEPCACGRTFAKLVGGILGRVDDMLIIRGVNVYPSAIENLIRVYPQVDEFMVEAFRVNEMYELRIRLEINESAYSTETIKSIIQEITDDINCKLLIRVQAETVPSGSLPRFDLKAKRFRKIN